MSQESLSNAPDKMRTKTTTGVRNRRNNDLGKMFTLANLAAIPFRYQTGMDAGTLPAVTFRPRELPCRQGPG